MESMHPEGSLNYLMKHQTCRLSGRLWEGFFCFIFIVMCPITKSSNAIIFAFELRFEN